MDFVKQKDNALKRLILINIKMKEPIKENKHDELLKLLNPLIDFMDKNEFSYLFVAGKDGKCSRYMRGRKDDLSGMLTGMAEKNKCVMNILKESLNDIDQDKINEIEVKL